jgi:thioredoxin-like negative regulator of GroEL
MVLLGVALLLLSILPSICANSGKVALKSRAVELTDSNYSDILPTSDKWVVALVSPRCVHCVRFKPVLQELASSEAFLSTNTRVGLIDIEKNPVLSARFLVMYLPSVYHLINENKAWTVRQVKGDRRADALQRLVISEFKEIEPLGFSSPFGPLGYLLGT